MNAWFISYHRCRSVIHLCRLSSRLILRALGFHQPGMTDPQLESHRSQLPTECLRRCTVYHPALRQDIDSFAFCFVTYPSNTWVWWQNRISAVSHQITWWHKWWDYSKKFYVPSLVIMNNALEPIYQNLCPSKSHLAFQLGHQQVAARTVEVVGTAVAESPKSQVIWELSQSFSFW